MYPNFLNFFIDFFICYCWRTDDSFVVQCRRITYVFLLQKPVCISYALFVQYSFFGVNTFFCPCLITSERVTWVLLILHGKERESEDGFSLKRVNVVILVFIKVSSYLT